MRRRDFLKTAGGLALASQWTTAWAENAGQTMTDETPSRMRQIEIKVGATTPFTALHISDTHLTRVDHRDNERKHSLAQGRRKMFPHAEKHLTDVLSYAAAQNILLLHTGDMIDFVSEANLDFVKESLRGVDCFMCAGNHEFSQYVGEAREDDAYKAASYDKVRAVCPNDLFFASRVVNGVNFVAMDDVYYNLTARQQALMEQEVRRGLPIVLMCHVPFYSPEQAAHAQKGDPSAAAYLTGAPIEVTSAYATNNALPPEEQWRNRSVQQKADAATLEFVAWLKEQKLLKAVLCGHCHYFFENTFSPTAQQYTVGSGYNGDAHLLRFV